MFGFTYLIHFNEPYQHARHYIGWARVLSWRMAHHQHGSGARLLQVLNQAGIGWRVVWVWPMTTRGFERNLKNRGGAARVCPKCGGNPPAGGKRPYRKFASV